MTDREQAEQELVDAGRNLADARRDLDGAMSLAQRAISAGAEAGVSEAATARLIGLNRMAVRKIAGKS